MASGVEHYRDAERAFENAKDSGPGTQQERFFLDAAQYHATMALAAATALNSHDGGMSNRDYNAWVDAASEIPAGSDA